MCAAGRTAIGRQPLVAAGQLKVQELSMRFKRAGPNGRGQETTGWKVKFMAIHVLGIDIGSYAAKVVMLGNIKAGRATLLGLGMSQLPNDVVLEWEDNPAPARTAISQAMKNLVARSKLTGKYVSTSVSGDSIIVKKIIMPVMSGDSLKKAVMEEAEQYIPFAINDVNVSYHILETSPLDNHMVVLLVAAKKSVVQNYMEAISLAKLKPAVIDVDGLALFNAYDFLHPDQHDNVVLADIGANMLNITVLHNGLPMIIKDEPGGGQYLTNEIASIFDMDMADAEAVKFGSMEAPNPGEVADAVDRAVGNWIAAVERVLDSARAEDSLFRPTAIYLSGGSSLLRQLPEEFEKYFGIRVERLNPLTSTNYNAKKYDQEYLEYIGPQLAVSFGLALRKVEVE
ncbi:hypothetical protein C4J81_08250 [Deltaproteobacteria bacterium Smac51]|nr:hypothetical protein C4J81_08250 [Deltaproteobacteria bacterium Smac51]